MILRKIKGKVMPKKSKIESIRIEAKKRNFLVEIVMKKGTIKHKNKKKEILDKIYLTDYLD